VASPLASFANQHRPLCDRARPDAGTGPRWAHGERGWDDDEERYVKLLAQPDERTAADRLIDYVARATGRAGWW